MGFETRFDDPEDLGEATEGITGQPKTQPKRSFDPLTPATAVLTGKGKASMRGPLEPETPEVRPEAPEKDTPSEAPDTQE